MPAGMVTINRYSIRIYPHGMNHQAYIRLYRTNGTLAGILRFYPPESTMPSHSVSSSFPTSGYGTVNYPFSELACVIDLLRNEKPIYFCWVDSTSTTTAYGYVGTDQEPVGEEETE